MNTSDLIARGEAALNRIESQRTRSDGAVTLRLATHLLRPKIEEMRRRGVQWAQIAAAICDACALDCDDPKERGRQVSQYHREPPSKLAEREMARVRSRETLGPGAVSPRVSSRAPNPRSSGKAGEVVSMSSILETGRPVRRGRVE